MTRSGPLSLNLPVSSRTPLDLSALPPTREKDLTSGGSRHSEPRRASESGTLKLPSPCSQSLSPFGPVLFHGAHLLLLHPLPSSSPHPFSFTTLLPPPFSLTPFSPPWLLFSLGLHSSPPVSLFLIFSLHSPPFYFIPFPPPFSLLHSNALMLFVLGRCWRLIWRGFAPVPIHLPNPQPPPPHCTGGLHWVGAH